MSNSDKVSKKAERLARALCALNGLPTPDMSFDRAHVFWVSKIEEAKELIFLQNMFTKFEDYDRPLYGSVESAEHDRILYNEIYSRTKNHLAAMAAVLGVDKEDV